MKRLSAKSELEKTNKIISALAPTQRELCEGLIADASFMAEQLEALRQHITENGWSEGYQNGANQFGRKQSAEAEIYIRLQKNYASIIRQLTDLLPSNKDEALTSAGEKLASFVGASKIK